MRKIYKIALAIIIALPLVTSAQTTPVSWTRNVSGGFVFPNILTDYIKVNRIVATSTTATSTFANGIDISGGCFAVNGTCFTGGGGGGGSGTVSSGTQGQNAFYDSTGSTVSGTSTIFISNASKVGIGTTTPNTELHIAKSVGSFPALGTDTGLVLSNTSVAGNSAALSVIAGTTGFSTLNLGDSLDENVGYIQYGHSNNYMAFGINTNEFMRITSTGNVGIGTTTPAETFVVGQNRFRVDSNGRMKLSGTQNAFGTSIIDFSNSTSFNSASAVTGLNGETTNTGAGSVTGSSINAVSSYAGTVSSLTAVQGSLRTLNSATTITNSRMFFAASPTITAGNITNQYGLYIDTQRLASTTNAFGIYQNGTSDTNYFGGNVGIGSTSPTYPLTVTGNMWQQGKYAKFGDSTSGFTCIGLADACVELSGDGNTAGGVFYQVGNRNAGTSAYSGLTILNDLGNLGNNATYYAGLFLNSSGYNDATFGTANNVPNILQLGNTMGSISIQASSTLSSVPSFIQFLAGGVNTTNEIARITTAGLGIGSSTPYAKLSVTQTGTAPTAIFEDSASPDTTPVTIDAGGNVIIGAVTGLTSARLDVNGLINTSVLSNPIVVASGNTDTPSGIEYRNISTGTSADSRIAVSNNSATDYLAMSYPGSGNTLTLFGRTRNTISSLFQTGTRALMVGTLGAGQLGFGTNNLERMTIDTAGNVGIGTLIPNQIFVIQQSTTTGPLTAKIHNTAGNANGDVRIFMGTSGTAGNETVGASILADRTDISGGGCTDIAFNNSQTTTVAEKMRIRCDGNVGIGTTTPGTAFTVNGTITSTSTAPVVTACGTGPVVLGNNNWGEILTGSGATGCTVTFATAYPVYGSCVISNQSMSLVNAMSYTDSRTGFTVTQTGLGGSRINYKCDGY